jgi:hypothetical protein
LRAIAERNGSAGFSEIKNATGLSTGSIYYHLERMGNYVTKDSKHYKITEEGLELLREILREIDNRSTVTSVHDKEEETSTSLAIQTEETIRQPRPLSELVRDYSTSLLIVVFLVFVSLGLYVNLQVILQALITAIFIGNKIITHTSLISSFLISVLLLMSFLIMLKKQLMPAGHSKMMVSL